MTTFTEKIHDFVQEVVDKMHTEFGPEVGRVATAAGDAAKTKIANLLGTGGEQTIPDPSVPAEDAPPAG